MLDLSVINKLNGEFDIGTRVKYIKEGKPFSNLDGTIVDSGGYCWIVKFDVSFEWGGIKNETIMACMEENLIII